MNITFGSSINSSQTSNVLNTEARSGVVVPAASENVDSTSFAPVNEVEKNAKSKQESSEQGIELRLASEQARSDQKNDSKAARELQEQQQTDQRQQKEIEQSQVDQRIAERRQIDEQEQRQLEVELKQIQQLADRDREVRTHEQAHQSVGGQYAGAMSLTYERGPDGQNYAVAGEVPIDTGKVPGNPQATLDKAETVRRAALAPAEPSSQDRRVASEAVLMTVEARADIQEMQREALVEKSREEDTKEVEDNSSTERSGVEQKAQSDGSQGESVEGSSGADIQALNERLSRIQAQIVEISQIDDKASSKVNLLDVAT